MKLIAAVVSFLLMGAMSAVLWTQATAPAEPAVPGVQIGTQADATPAASTSTTERSTTSTKKSTTTKKTTTKKPAATKKPAPKPARTTARPAQPRATQAPRVVAPPPVVYDDDDDEWDDDEWDDDEWDDD